MSLPSWLACNLTQGVSSINNVWNSPLQGTVLASMHPSVATSQKVEKGRQLCLVEPIADYYLYLYACYQYNTNEALLPGQFCELALSRTGAAVDAGPDHLTQRAPPPPPPSPPLLQKHPPSCIHHHMHKDSAWITAKEMGRTGLGFSVKYCIQDFWIR